MVKFEKSRPTEKELNEMGVLDWPTWESDPPPGFEWEYTSKEIFYVLEGEAEIDSDGEKIRFEKGDLVTVYPETGECYWNVKKIIHKHYKFE